MARELAAETAVLVGIAVSTELADVSEIAERVTRADTCRVLHTFPRARDARNA